MIFKLTALTVAALSCASAHADDGLNLKFSGFGTLAAVHSSERNADFVGTSAQPTGAGHSESTSFGPDSRLGVQATATYGDKLSAVLQLVSQHQWDNSYTPEVEWANVKYQLTSEISVRLGRIASPTFMVSESRLVGYSNPWVRPPLEVYSSNPITSNDGIDATYRHSFGAVNNTLQGYYGSRTVKQVGGGTTKIKSAWGFNDSVEFGSLTARAAYNVGAITLNIGGVNALIDGFSALASGAGSVPLPAYQTAAAQASALANKYRPNDVMARTYTIGASYDPGQWFVQSEFSMSKFGEGLLANTHSWYFTGGYRFGSFTPYATYSSAKSNLKSEPGIPAAGLDPATAGGAAALVGGLNATLSAFSATQSNIALGLRWDFMANLALKGQYDRLTTGADSGGRLANLQPGFVPGGKVSLVTVALDFVF